MGAWIKIGYTAAKDASRRIAQLQTGQPETITLLGTILGGRDAEAGLHLELEMFRGNGEWFERDAIKGTVQYLIEHQHPWFYCRTKGLYQLWERTFAVKDPGALSSYEDFPIEEGNDEAWRGRARAVNMRIRKRRMERQAKDKVWEENLRENAKYGNRPYILAWKALGRDKILTFNLSS